MESLLECETQGFDFSKTFFKNRDCQLVLTLEESLKKRQAYLEFRNFV